MLSFGDFERRMLSYFQRGTEILHNGKRMIVEEAGKPTCSYGEPKTDVYVAARSNYGIEEIKISYKKENAKYQLNLWRANEAVFEEAGILKEHIAVTNLCTHCNPDLLFSHRTTGNARGNLSAFLALQEV